MIDPALNIPEELPAHPVIVPRSVDAAFEEFLQSCAQMTLEERKRDPLFSDRAVWEGDAPADLSERVDDYLYGEEA
jgi:hypothetical protein